LIDKKILLSLIIVILIGATAVGYQITNSTSEPSQPPISQDTITTNQGSSNGTSLLFEQQTPGGVNVNVTAEEAKLIAQKYIEEPGAIAGTPELKTVGGSLVYVVPVILNNTIVGEIYIDPQNGKNVGGAGGAPNG